MMNILDFLKTVFLPWIKETVNSSSSPFVRILGKILSAIIYVASMVAVLYGLITMSSCSAPAVIRATVSTQSLSTGITDTYTVEVSDLRASATVPISTSTNAQLPTVQNPPSPCIPVAPVSEDYISTDDYNKDYRLIANPSYLPDRSTNGRVIGRTGMYDLPEIFPTRNLSVTTTYPFKNPDSESHFRPIRKSGLQRFMRAPGLITFKKSTTSYE